MGKKTLSYPISLLISIFLISQFIPITQSLQSYSQNSREFTTSSSVCNIFLVGKQLHKALFQSPSNFTPITTYHILNNGVHLANYFYQEKPFDFRKIIKQSISHYFNGSKYKQIS